MVRVFYNAEGFIMPYRSNLERILSEGRFSVTAEIGPPKGADSSKIIERANLLKVFR